MRLRKSLLATIALTAGVGMLVAGCSSSTNNSSGNTTNNTSTSSKPTPGGVINYALPGATSLTWFFPIMTAANDSVYNQIIVDQMYKPLIWINNDYTINWKSSVADKITYNNQGTVYHIFLNPKWKWSDGTPVTAQDVLFSWQVIKAASSKSAPAPWPFAGVGTGGIPNQIQSVVANNNYEVTITLNKPANQQWFIYNGIIQLTPMPKKAWDVKSNMQDELKYLGQNATNLMFDKVVDGPFMPKSATPNQSWDIVPNPNYAGHKSIVQQINFDYEASTAAELAALKAGNINMGYVDTSELGNIPSLKQQGYNINVGYPFGVFYTVMNMWPRNDVREAVRSALHAPSVAVWH